MSFEATDPDAATAEPSFSAAWPLGNRHAQTVWASLCRFPRLPRLTSQVWQANDGEAVDVDLLPVREGRPGVLILHGLEGSSRATYVRGLLAAIAARGWNGMAVNFRSCGRSARAPSRLYHMGDTRDLPFVIQRARALWPGVGLGAVGFSLGGNVLLKWMGELGDASPLHGAVAVSVPFDLAACARELDGRGFWPAIYRTRFLVKLRRKAVALAAFDAKTVRRCRTFRDFDGLVTAPLNGFTGAEDYWNRCSAREFLAGIRRPTLVIASRDDPFVPPEALPVQALRENPAITTWITERGGHVGFVGGTLLRPRYQAEQVALGFLATRFATVAPADSEHAA